MRFFFKGSILEEMVFVTSETQSGKFIEIHTSIQTEIGCSYFRPILTEIHAAL